MSAPAPTSSRMASLAESAKLQAADATAAFKANKFPTAEAAYLNALHTANSASDGLYIALLQNLATAHLQLNQPRHALMHAVAVMALFPNTVPAKAYVLAARAAGAMWDQVATAWLICQTPASSATDAIRYLSREVDVQIGSYTNHPVLESSPLAMAVVHAALALPDPSPDDGFFPRLQDVAKHACAHDAGANIDHTDFASQMSLAAAAKAEGNERYKAADFLGAILKWRYALALLPVLDSITTSNLAQSVAGDTKDVKVQLMMMQQASHRDVGDIARQVIYQTVALLWDHRNPQIHLGRACQTALLDLDENVQSCAVSTALLCTEQALRSLSDHPGLLEIQGVLNSQLHARYHKELKSDPESASCSLAEIQHAMETEGGTSTLNHQESAAHGGVMRQLILAAPKHKLKYGKKIAGPEPLAFGKTYMKSGLLPPSCDVNKCAEHLSGGANTAFMHWGAYMSSAMQHEDSGGHSGRHSAGGSGRTHARTAGACVSLAGGQFDVSKISDKVLRLQDAFMGSENVGVGAGGIAFRLRGAVHERIFWWRRAPVGDVAVFMKQPYHATRIQLQSFSNVQHHALPLWRDHQSESTQGLTERVDAVHMTPPAKHACDTCMHVHVAVGFVDLGDLAATLAKNQQRQERQYAEAGAGCNALGDVGGETGPRAMRWVGYEASAHACARTIVITQMLVEKAPVDTIVQVWYSSTWTKETLQCFHSAIKSVLDPKGSNAGPTKHGRELMSWLRRWASAEVSLQTARREWFKRQVDSCCYIANVMNTHDCHALCGYRLTGELLGGSTGSITMFELVEGEGKTVDYTNEESLLITIPPEELMDSYRAVQKHAGSAADRTFVAAALEVARRRVMALQTAISQNKLTIQVHHKHALASDTKFAATVRALKPDSMSWSNIVDYMQPQAFHHMAIACSLPNTRHFLHSMNWPEMVKGSCLTDYVEMPRSRRETVVKRCEILGEALEAVRTRVADLGGHKVLHVPPLGNRINVTDPFLMARMHGVWVKAFSGMVPGGVVVDVMVLHEPGYWYFVRAGSVMHLELSYRSVM